MFTDELLKESAENPGILVVQKLDLSSLKSVREFAQKINQEEKRLDVLIHNAGTAETFRKMVSEDGLEMTMATNHYGPFLLTHLLIGTLKKKKVSKNLICLTFFFIKFFLLKSFTFVFLMKKTSHYKYFLNFKQ